MLNSKKIAVVLIILIAVVWTINVKKPKKRDEIKSDSQVGVDIEVTPQTLGFNNKENVFEVKLDTHSVNLDFDLAKMMILTDNLGNQYQPIRWEGGSGGHHLSGKIVFPQLKSGVKKIILKISGIGGVERNFKWGLTNNSR